MIGKQPLIALFILLVSVLFLRRHQVSLFDSALNATARLLQSSTTAVTFAEGVSQKLCSSYDYVAPTADDSQDAYDISSQVGKLRSHNTVKDLIGQGYVQDDLVDEYLSHFVPFILALGIPCAICTALFILCVINWSCMCCPSCSVLRCGMCDRPSTKSRINFYAIFSILFSMCLLGASIAGISLFDDITGKVDGTMCQTTFMLEELYDGKNENDWFGINPLENLLETLRTDLYSTKDMFKNINNNFTRIQNKLDAISFNLDTIKDGYEDRNVTRANFMEETAYVPQFLSSMDATLDLAYESVDYFNSNLTDARSEFNNAVSDFSSERDSVTTALTSGIVQAQGISKDIMSSLNWLNDHGETVHSVAKGMSIAVKVCLAVIIAFSAFTLVSAIINFWSKYKHFSQCIHLAWFIIGIFTVVAWIAAAVLFPATVACVEVCQVVEEVLSNATFANMTLDSFFGTEESSLKETLVVCLHGSGDIIDNFAVKDKLSLIEPLNEAISDAAASVDGYVLPTTVDMTEITDLLSSISNNSQVDDPKTLIDLETLNTYNYLNVNTGDQCAEVGDKWVLNETYCEAYDISTVMTTSDPDTYMLGSPLCIPLASWTEPGTRIIADRYTGTLYSDCPSVVNPNLANTRYNRSAFVQGMVTRFTRNRQNIVDLVDDIMGNVNDVNDQADDLLATTKAAMVAPFNLVKNFADTMEALVFDPTDGLVYNTQCGFVTTRVEELNNELCVNLIPTIYNTSISLIVGSIMATLLTLVLYMLARKLASKQVEYTRAKTYPQ